MLIELRESHFHQVQQPGKITRLLSMGGSWPLDPNPHPFGDHLMKEINTHVVPEYDSNVDSYPAYNKVLNSDYP